MWPRGWRDIFFRKSQGGGRRLGSRSDAGELAASISVSYVNEGKSVSRCLADIWDK